MAAKTATVAGIAFLVILAACERPTPGPTTTRPSEVTVAAAKTFATDDSNAVSVDLPQGIDWFAGSVEEAFDFAKSNGKPVYLYWGAEWCPPCHAIKATVFRSPEFLARSKLFVPVYLDGDTENAQATGEKFGVLGYPTMIVFDPQGNELTRIPGGLDILAYANVLDLTLGNSSSATGIVGTVIGEGGSLSAPDCRMLTYYAWNQDPTILDDYVQQDAHRRIYDACPAELTVERAILFMNYLDALIDATEEESSEVSLTQEQIDEALPHVEQILAEPELSKANLFAVLFSGAKVTRALTEKGSVERERLARSFKLALDRLAEDESVYKRERIYTGIGKIYLERLDDRDAEISHGLKQEIAELVKWADESTPDPYERQPIVNAASILLDEAGMNDVARPLLVAELERSKQPYYFMVSLADIEQNAGNHEEAIAWLKEAYDTARGPATRFQWGYYYINGLIEMTPQDGQLIHETTLNVIRELEAGSGIYQRPKAQLARLESKLEEWGESQDNAEGLRSIRNDVLMVCANLPAEEESQSTCQSFLEAA